MTTDVWNYSIPGNIDFVEEYFAHVFVLILLFVSESGEGGSVSGFEDAMQIEYVFMHA